MKKIKDFEDYSVSKDGVVYSHKTNRILSQTKTNRTDGATCGYMQVYLYYEKRKKKTRLVHRLVAEAYIPNPENKRTVNHIDGDKTNNHVSNLEWATDSENALHAHRNGLVKTNSGADHHNSKGVEVYDKYGNILDVCCTAREAEARGYGDFRNISAVCNGKRKTHNGFVFKFEKQK